jgi:hypothetical protein
VNGAHGIRETGSGILRVEECGEVKVDETNAASRLVVEDIVQFAVAVEHAACVHVGKRPQKLEGNVSYQLGLQGALWLRGEIGKQLDSGHELKDEI